MTLGLRYLIKDEIIIILMVKQLRESETAANPERRQLLSQTRLVTDAGRFLVMRKSGF